MTSDLPPLLHPLVSDFLTSQDVPLSDTVEIFGSPLHIVFPALFRENAEKYRTVFRQNNLNTAQTYFAAKANKAETFLEEAANSAVGIDVSSLEELRTALAHGIAGERIGVSGPAKKDRLLALAIQHGCAISIDSLHELESLLHIIPALHKIRIKPRILLRLNGMNPAHSRFGLSPSMLPDIFAKIPPHASSVHLEGFHFHLSGYSTDERTSALQMAIAELQNARSLGYSCNTINMGGGFAVRYVSREHWERFLGSQKKESFLGDRKIDTFYPYGNEVSGSEQLRDILLGHRECHGRIADLLKEQGIRLAIEPGRSLLDQAGVTCIQIKGVKPATDGRLVVEVDANINHLSEQWFGSEYCVDPIHMPKDRSGENSPMQAAIAGNTCLEIDMLSWRAINFRSIPKAGDLLVFANTAGYQMDSNESAFHRLPIPEKIAAYKRGERWRYKRDGEYSFLDANDHA